MTTTRYPYYAVRTAYHGGGIISRHTTRALAEQAARRYAAKDCACGCAGAVATIDYAALPHMGTQPRYDALARLDDDKAASVTSTDGQSDSQ